MTYDSAPGFSRRRLLTRCLEARPRVVRLITKPGWGESVFARQLAAATGTYGVCECAGVASAEEFETQLAAALAGESAAVVVDSAEHLQRIPAAAAAFARLADAPPPGCLLVVASRDGAALGPSRNVAPHEALTLRAVDLAFDDAEVREIFAGLTVSEPQLARIVELARGWAIAVFLFARFAREGMLAAALADLAGPMLDDLYAYVQRETIATWGDDERRGVAAVIAIPGATAVDVEAIAGRSGLRAVEHFVARGGPLRIAGERFEVPELTRHAAERLLPDLLREARAAGVSAAIEAGSRVRAAEILLEAGEFEPALAELEALQPAEAGARSAPRYAALAARLPPDLVLRSRNVLVALFASRTTQSYPNAHRLLPIVERFAEALGPGSDAELTCGTLTAYGVLLRACGHRREALRVLTEAERLDDPSAERAALVQANLGAVEAMHGNVAAARGRFERAGVALDGPTRFPHERFELETMLGHLGGDPARARAAYLRNVEEAREWGPPAVAYAMRYLATGAWFAGDDAAATGAVERLNAIRLEIPAEQRRPLGTRPRLDERVDRYDRWTCIWYVNAALLEVDAETAQRFITVALDGFRELDVPFWDAIASLVAASIPGMPVEELVARARSAAATIGAAAMGAAVDALAAEIAGAEPGGAGILQPLSVRIARARAVRGSLLRVEVLTGRVLAGDEVLRIRERELELLVVLALEGRPLTPEALVARLCDADEGTAALRTAVYRLRKQLRDPEAVVSTPAGYRLAETIPIDALEAERFLTGARRFGALNDRERLRMSELLGVLARGVPSQYLRWEWFAPFAGRLDDLLHDLGIALAEDDLRRGDVAAAIERADVLLRADALDEPANELAIKAHLAAGRKSEALRRYRRYRDALLREYGTVPDAEMTGLLA